MHRGLRPRLLLASVVALLCAGCPSVPPAVTGITIFPADVDGAPRGALLWRTREQPPVRVIGVRPGTNMQEFSPFLNDPATGDVAITLARGTQNFLLFAAVAEPQTRFVIAIYLDHEPTPALAAIATNDLTRPAVPSQAAVLMGLDGQPVPNQSAIAVTHAGYRISLLRAAFPLDTSGVDALNLWRLRWDTIPDWAGVITLQVESPAG